MLRRIAMTALLALGWAGAARAEDRVTLTLNWIPGSDHAPIYWAQQAGRYRDAGIDLTIETGRGSAFAASRAGSGGAQFGIVDTPAALQARGAGADLVGVMAIYVQSPYGIYWRRSSGIRTAADLRGRRLGVPPADAARVMWPMIARAVGIPPGEVTWVNIAPSAKVASLQSGAVDATTDFYNFHRIWQRAFGDDLGFARVRDLGFNPYGNALFVNGPWLRANRDAATRFTRVTQRAYADCLAQPAPCIAATSVPSGQPVADLTDGWALVVELMADDPAAGRPLGGFDPARMATTLDAVRQSVELPAFPVTEAYTNDLLDPAVRPPH